MDVLEFLYEGIVELFTDWKALFMIAIGCLLIFLAIKKELEPALLLPMGLGAILVNLPMSGVIDQTMEGIGPVKGIIDWAVRHWYRSFGSASPAAVHRHWRNDRLWPSALQSEAAAVRSGGCNSVFFSPFWWRRFWALICGDAASIGIIGAADGPTSILVSQVLGSRYIGAIAVAAYSYMALVPIIQPFAIKLVTTKKERAIRMPYNPRSVSKSTRILFPIVVTIIAGLVAPASVSLVGFLMFGNLIRECGVLNTLSNTAQKELANLITLLLGITISASMKAENFVNLQTLMIMALGLLAFIFDSIAGVLFAKLLNLFCKNKVNPMVGAAGISAFPMSARVVQKLGLEADNQNHLLMHAVGANVSGQIASVIAGGVILGLVPALIG